MKIRLRFVTSLSAFAIALMMLLSLVVTESARAQKGTTSLGTDFWISFMPNYTVPANNIRVFVASGTTNKVHVDFFGGSSIPAVTKTQTLQPNTVMTVFVSGGDIVEERIPEKPEFKAVHVYADNPIAVYGITNSAATTDSYLGIPTPGLGTAYLPSCFYDDYYYTPDEPLAGEFVVVAPYDNTEVTIHNVRSDTRSDPTGKVSHKKGDTWTVTLMRGQTYLVQSTGLHYGDEDLTGTYITSTKPVGLISGHQRCSIPVGAPGNSKDHLCEMIPPVDKWGTEYYDMPMAQRVVCGDYIRLIAGDSNVSITENGAQVAVLSAPGDFVDRELILNPTVYKSTDPKKKFLVVQHSYTEGYDGDPAPGDPFSIVMTPKEQFQKTMIFRTPSNYSGGGTYTHYATFICLADSILKIKINGRSISSYNNVGQANIPGTSPPMAAKRITLPSIDGAYVASCGAPFGLYLYGFTDVESYGHPAGMALRIVSPDTLPPLEIRDSQCGNFKVQYYETRHTPKFSFEDTRINEINLIAGAGDVRWSKPSYNYQLTFDQPFTPGDSVAFFTLSLIDPTKDGYAAVWTVDKAGNDTVYEYNYVAPKLASLPAPTYDFSPVRVGLDSCMTVTIKNAQATGDVKLTTAAILGTATAGKFTVTPTSLNRTLHPQDTVQLKVCFTPTDTLTSYDSLIVSTECVPFPFALQGMGVTPIIVASDVDFGAVPVGDTVCKPVTVRNVGNAPLTLDKSWALSNNSLFTFEDYTLLPVTILPGKSYTFTFCYHPSDTTRDTSVQRWSTDILPPFAHLRKDTSSLTGYGIRPGLNWDRLSQSFTTECDVPTYDTVYLINPYSPTGSDINITKVDVEGPDADEFLLVDNELHYLPLENTQKWPLANGASKWILIEFKPNLSKQYRLRTAKVVAYGQSTGTPPKPFLASMDLTGTVRHSTIRVTPKTFDFGAVAPGTPLTTTVMIHNDGDTTLVLDQLSITGGYAFSGVAKGTMVAPGDSVQVTVTITAPEGLAEGTFTTSQTTACNSTDTSHLKTLGTFLQVDATPATYGNVYQCKSGTAVVSTTNLGSKGLFLDSVRIVDPSGQVRFTDDNSQMKKLGVPMAKGDQKSFSLTFTPNAKGALTATMIQYFYLDTSKSPAQVVEVDRTISGTGLHYTNTLSAKSTGAAFYSATPGQTVTVPIQMSTDLDQLSNVYGIEFTLRYRRDEFNYGTINPQGGLVPSSTNYTSRQDPTDPAYDLVTFHLRSTTPIAPMPLLANVQLQYVLAADTLTNIEVQDLKLLDAVDSEVCWVTEATEPGLFVATDLCGDQTMRHILNNTNPFSVKSISPNPVSSKAGIEYQINENGTPMTIEVFNVLGEKTRTLMDKKLHLAGTYTATFDASSLPSGTYTIRIATPKMTESKQIVVSK